MALAPIMTCRDGGVDDGWWGACAVLVANDYLTLTTPLIPFNHHVGPVWRLHYPGAAITSITIIVHTIGIHVNVATFTFLFLQWIYRAMAPGRRKRPHPASAQPPSLRLFTPSPHPSTTTQALSHSPHQAQPTPDAGTQSVSQYGLSEYAR